MSEPTADTGDRPAAAVGAEPPAAPGHPDLPARARPAPLPAAASHRPAGLAALPIHPILAGAYPVLALYGANLEEAAPEDVWMPLLAAVALAVVVTLLAWPMLRSVRRAALVGSVCVLLFLTYGRAFEALEGRRLFGVLLGRNIVLFPLWGALAGAAVILAKRAGAALDRLTVAANAAALAMVAAALVPVLTDRPAAATLPPLRDDPIMRSAHGAGVPAKDARDIYYVIFDRYAGATTLREMFGYDNTPFLEELRRMGFTVPERSLANYPNTTLSLASSLNMQHLDDLLTKRVGEDAPGWGPAHALYRDPAAARYLESKGYRFVNIGSWWEPTRTNDIADVNFVYDPLSEFSRALVKTTAAWPLAKRFGWGSSVLDPRDAQRHRVHYQFDKLVETARMREPTFAFAHFTSPHEPYVFDRRGRFRTAEEERAASTRANYVEQLRYINARILRLLRTLLAVPEERRPIIILQSDEGPQPGDVGHRPADFRWSTATRRQLLAKFRILNAYYLPGAPKDAVYETITPVNSFRVVFNVYFDAGFPLVEDESYIFPDWAHKYRFDPVTDRVRPPKG